VKKIHREIELNGCSVPYKLIKRKRHHSFTLSVHAGGRITLTIPKRVSDKQAHRFLVQKRTWLTSALETTPQQQGLSVVNREHYKTYKEKARLFILTRLAELNTQYGYMYKKVYIRANTSRWGSCSGYGNLNFDYRIMFLPRHLQDYILVHELCHLREMNHSKRFWKLVEQAVPNHRTLRKELRRQEV
jgi:predicted metal-dependent hydrolase